MNLIDRVNQAFDYFNSFRLEELKEDDVYYIHALMKRIEILEEQIFKLKKQINKL
jgi:hypothetical protein